MKKAVQQIMIGSVVKNEATARETLRRIREAGYDAIELNRFMIQPSGWMVRALTRAAGMPTGNGGKLPWAQLVKESGLGVAALHVDLGSLEREPETVARQAKDLGTDVLAITGMYRFDYGDEAAVRALAARLNAAGAATQKLGLSLLYHNHNAELLHVGSGRCALDMLLAETDPALLGFELDTFWLADGGADALYWMKKLGKRVKLWHVTDRGAKHGQKAMTPILKQDSRELGDGAMNLTALWQAAVESGVETVVLESHKNWLNGDPLQSLERSAKWLAEVDA